MKPMLVRLNILAAVTALAGHLVGIVGLPSPAAPTVAEVRSAATPAAKTERKCRCACGDGCGPCCCCSGETQPAPAPGAENEWQWIASLEVQKCFDTGSSGMADLPPGLPNPQSVGCVPVSPMIEVIHLTDAMVISISAIPPTPPPRGA